MWFLGMLKLIIPISSALIAQMMAMGIFMSRFVLFLSLCNC